MCNCLHALYIILISSDSCLAVNDLLRGRPLDDVVDDLPTLWQTCFRVRDDIKVSWRVAFFLITLLQGGCRSVVNNTVRDADDLSSRIPLGLIILFSRWRWLNQV